MDRSRSLLQSSNRANADDRGVPRCRRLLVLLARRRESAARRVFMTWQSLRAIPSALVRSHGDVLREPPRLATQAHARRPAACEHRTAGGSAAHALPSLQALQRVLLLRLLAAVDVGRSDRPAAV